MVISIAPTMPQVVAPQGVAPSVVDGASLGKVQPLPLPEVQCQVRALRHAVANSLTHVIGSLDLLLAGYYGPLTQAQHDVVAAALAGAQRIGQTVHRQAELPPA